MILGENINQKAEGIESPENGNIYYFNPKDNRLSFKHK